MPPTVGWAPSVNNQDRFFIAMLTGPLTNLIWAIHRLRSPSIMDTKLCQVNTRTRGHLKLDISNILEEGVRLNYAKGFMVFAEFFPSCCPWATRSRWKVISRQQNSPWKGAKVLDKGWKGSTRIPFFLPCQNGKDRAEVLG